MTERAWTPMDRLASAWVDEIARQSPTFAVSAGLPGDPAAYDDYSPAGLAAYQEASRRVQRELSTLEPADDVDRVTKHAMLRDLELGTELYESGWWFRDLNNIASPAQGIRDVIDNMPTATVEDWETIGRRLRNLPGALAGYRETLEHGMARGLVPARRQVRVVVDQLGGHLGESGYFADLARRAPSTLPDAARREVTAASRAAADAYAAFREFLATDLLPVAGEQDGVGRDFYALLSRFFVGASVDLDDTYEWGLEEVARIAAEQQRVAEQILPGATVREAMAHLDADPATAVHGAEALREWMQELADGAVARLGASEFDIPEPVRRIECMIAPTHTGGIYYTGPNDDFSRPGRMWWSVPEGVDVFHTWREATTVYHEGVPGHHLQIGIATARRDRLNPWRRLAAGSSGFWEGWALYAERLMDELGFLATPGERMGMLDAQRMRAVRVAIDIGVHLGKPCPTSAGGDGATPWTAADASRFFRENVDMEETAARFEVERYLGWPGQAPSYKIGERIWRAERDRAKDGSRAFHRRALDLGNLSLDSLQYALRLAES